MCLLLQYEENSIKKTGYIVCVAYLDVYQVEECNESKQYIQH